MTKSDQLPPDATNSPPATTAWGTWEELLLAYAVNRYGTTNWTSISSELRKRSSAPINLTPYYCEQKYRDLNRRFNQSDAAAAATAAAVPWLEELRNLRVLELQRELRNYDLYISSLQTKVKRLTEESEKSGGDGAVSGDDDGDGGGSDRDNQSVNGSNGNLNNGNGVVPVRTGDGKPESAAVILPEDDLFNIRPEGNEPVESEPDRDASEVKSEGKNSDMQSSVSKSISDRVPRGTSKEDDQSTDSIPVRSLPLVDFLLKVQKLGSVVFERRLDRQEKLRYQNLIRQHIDYETLQTRLKQGQYSDGNDKFFRDLLLLVNNTRIFFPKQSPESNAAVDLRLHILNEMILKKKQKTDSKPTHKRPVDAPDSSLLKPKLSGPIVVCRKRSSITAKAAAGSSSGKREQTGSKGPEKLIEQTGSKKSRDSLPLINKKKGKSPVNESSDTKPEKKKKLTEAEEKKQSAAKFLNRMKRSNEPSERGSSENDSRGEQRKSKGGGGGDGKKDQAGKKSSGGKQAKEQDSPGKRNVGRPPKRAAASPPLASVSGKRTRESVGSEFGSKQIKKRSKR